MLQTNKGDLAKVESDYQAATENLSDLQSIYEATRIAVKQKEAQIKRIKNSTSSIYSLPFMNTTFEPKSQTSGQRAPQSPGQGSIAFPSRVIVHARLEMTEPGDYDEQEADTMANTIVSGGKISRKISGGGGSSGIAVSQQMKSQLSQLQDIRRQMPENMFNKY